MIPILQPLPLDWSGVSIHNRTKGEIHDLTNQFGLPYRVVIMEKGYFYEEGLVIIDSNGYRLTKEDYQCTAISKEIADETAKAAFAVILISNPDVRDILRIDAQMVGGRYCNLNTAILESARNVILGANRKLYYKNIKDKPSEFRPSGHLHALWDLFGFTEQTGIIKRMTTAIDLVTRKEFVGLFDEFNIEFDTVRNSMTSIDNRLTTHIEDKSNPHQLTAIQVVLHYVFNGSVATAEEAGYESGTVTYAYTTPLRSKQVVDKNFTPNLTQHINDLNNPHRDTAASLGTLTTFELQTLANRYYNIGDTVTKSSGLDGRTFAQYYTYIRQAIPAVNITTGILPNIVFSNTATPPAASILQPTTNGRFTWRSIQEIFNTYSVKGNQIIYVTAYNAVSAAGAMTHITSTIGTNYPENTIAILRANTSISRGTSNGSIVTYISSIYMGVLTGGVWRIPGFT